MKHFIINFIKQITYSNVDVQVNIKETNVIDYKNNYFEITSTPKQLNVIPTQTEFNSSMSVCVVESQNIIIEILKKQRSKIIIHVSKNEYAKI